MSLRKKILFATAIFIGIPVLAETAVRIRDGIRFGSASPSDQLYLPHPQLGKVLRPGAVLSGTAEEVRINSRGFRAPEIAVPKPAGTFRIACLGGSTTFGTYNTGNDTTWPARLQAGLQEACPHLRIEVVNAGVPGYRLAESRINLLQRVLPLEPDLVVVYHACNDIHREQRNAYEPNRTGAEPSGVTQWLTRRSALFDKLAKNIEILRTPASEPGRRDSLPDQAVKNFRANLEALISECTDRRIPLVLATMATQFRADQPEDVRLKAANTALYYDRYLSVEGLIWAYRTFNAEIQAAARDNHLPCADVFTAVPGDARHFGDSVHLTDLGCQRVADCLLATLTDSGLIPPDQRSAARP